MWIHPSCAGMYVDSLPSSSPAQSLRTLPSARFMRPVLAAWLLSAEAVDTRMLPVASSPAIPDG